MKLDDNTILITGGGTGIGRALALALAQRGNTVLICGRRADVLEKTAAEQPGMHWYRCDLTKRGEIDAMCRQIADDGHAVNVLVNNAGILTDYNFARPESFDLDAAERDIGANLSGPITLTVKLLPALMAQSNPAVINVGSPGGIIPVSPYAIYAATKSGFHAFTQILRKHLKGRVYVAEVFPPTVETEMTQIVRRRKVGADTFIPKVLRGLEKDREEIWVGEGRAVKWMLNLLPPRLAFALINSQPSMKPR